ncbi:hypothetical protein LCGC14_3124830, partial [marine sediment metagenome]
PEIYDQVIDLPVENPPLILISEKEHLELKSEVGYWQAMHKKAILREKKLKQTVTEQEGKIRDLKNRLFGKQSEKKSFNKNEDPSNPSTSKRPRGQQPGGKGHERTTALALVQELDLTGILLSADALHTQPAWCRAVRRQGGDYLLNVKANQRLLRTDIALLFSEEPRPWLPEQSARQINPGHGRLEVRTIRTSCELNEYIAPKWTDVAQVFQLQRCITRRHRITTETTYGITSLSAQVAPPRRLLTLIRQYWQIENRLHWRRDVTLGEDACTVSRGQTPRVLATLNNTILALVDRLGVPNLAAQQRIFAARPDEALNLILHPI